MRRCASSLVVFARAPVPGQVKTRLGRTLGAEGAAALYRAFLEDVCALTCGVAERAVLAVAGESAALAELARQHGMRLAEQAGADLGARMDRALVDELAQAERVCIIGSDSPTLPRAHLELAFAELGRADFVLGPSHDGGYWLIGARTAAPELFRQQEWGSPAVLPETLRRLAGRSACLLPFHYDVDDAPDLELLCAHLLHLPATVAASTRRALAAAGLLC